jgi:hypothetical protein
MPLKDAAELGLLVLLAGFVYTVYALHDLIKEVEKLRRDYRKVHRLDEGGL